MDGRAVCLRFARVAGDPTPALWSQPIEVGEASTVVGYVPLPVRTSDPCPEGPERPPGAAKDGRSAPALSPYLMRLTTRLPPDPATLDVLHGPRVSRRVKNYTRYGETCERG